jgi:hypothetical protein
MKRNFLYARLESKVLSSKGKEIVRNYGVTIDAQAVCRDLARHHCPSTAASIAAQDIIGFLISQTLGWLFTFNAKIKNRDAQNFIKLFTGPVLQHVYCKALLQ